MDASKYFAIRRIVSSSSVWTPITVAIECSRIVLENEDTTNAAMVRSDQNDGDTQKSLPAGMELDIRSVVGTFLPNTIVAYVKQSSGTGPVVATFTR